MKILVIGGITYDDIIHFNEFPKPKPQTIFSDDYFQMIGGTGAGKAFNLNRLGLDVTLHAYIGNDQYGEMIKKKFKDENLNFDYDIDELGTERHINIINDNGERISIYVKSGTFEPKVNYEKLEKHIKNSDIVCLNILNYCRYLIPIIKKYKKKIWVDIHDYDGENQYHNDFIKAADVITMSSENMTNYSEFMKKMINDGKEFIICTHGKNGAEGINKDNEVINVPIINDYEFVDSNGAGDSFFSGVLYGYMNGYDLINSMRLGTIVSGLSISSKELFNKKLTEEFLLNQFNKYYK